AAFLYSPHRGWLIHLWQHRQQQRLLEETMVLVHLYQHEGTAAEVTEAAVSDLPQHLDWSPRRLERVLERLYRKQWVVLHQANLLRLTSAGRRQAQSVYGTIRAEASTPAF
ncbi:MAG: hypothetical protein NZU63_09180, partial [Gemmataceae bacterium]|nr:hypothetical protein [Gemmataceae bacterium]